MKTRAVVVAILGLLTISVAGYAYIAITPPTEPDNRQIQQVTAPAPTKYEVGPPDAQELLELVNAERVRVGVAPLVIDERLNQSAQAKADDMAKNNYFDHVDAAGKHGYEYAYEYNAECMTASENIYWGRTTNTTQGALNWWMNSKPHHDAILNSEYTLTGFGIAGNKVVEHFCIAR